jgi:hypothetical protein
MNDSTAERDEVRRILGQRLTEAELDDAIAAQRREDAWRAQPWPYAPANHAHRHSRPACSRCESGLAQCATPEACERADEDRPAVIRKLSTFIAVYRLYRREHPRSYAARIAYGIAFKGLPF